MVQPANFSSYLNHASLNCQSPNKETTTTGMHGSSIVAIVGLVGCPSGTWFIQLLDKIPLNVKLMVSRNLPQSTHREFNSPITWFTLSVKQLYNIGLCTTNQQGYMIKGYAFLIRSYNNMPFTCYLDTRTYVTYSIPWRYCVQVQTFQGPIHRINKHYIKDLLQKNV